MRVRGFCLVLGLALVLGTTGCGKGDKYELDTDKTVAYDSNRDGVPKLMGGPKGGVGKDAAMDAEATSPSRRR